MQSLLRSGIKKDNIPSNFYGAAIESTNKANETAVITNQILLSGISPSQLVELLRPMIREEVRLVMAEQEEKLISPAEACKLFKPAITKATLTSWTEKGWLQLHRIGGRNFYLQSEILACTLKLGKYRSLFA